MLVCFEGDDSSMAQRQIDKLLGFLVNIWDLRNVSVGGSGWLSVVEAELGGREEDLMGGEKMDGKGWKKLTAVFFFFSFFILFLFFYFFFLDDMAYFWP
jgi:hypothetical protein